MGAAIVSCSAAVGAIILSMHIALNDMTKSAKKIFRDALGLSASERAALIDQLISSLDKPDPSIDALWAKRSRGSAEGF